MAANCASIKQHLETFIKHVEELRQTDDDDMDGFEKEYKVSAILLQNLYDCVWECQSVTAYECSQFMLGRLKSPVSITLCVLIFLSNRSVARGADRGHGPPI